MGSRHGGSCVSTSRPTRSTRAFLPGLDGGVTDAAFVGSRLIIAGAFTRHLRAINTASGADTGYINLKLEGKVDPNDAIRVRRFAANPAGTALVALGNFTSVAGQPRTQAFRVDLTPTTKAALSPWHAPRFDVRCRVPMSSRGVDFSPDGSYFVVVTSGGPNGTVGLWRRGREVRDRERVATAGPTWINWTGGDSLYSVAATGAAVYVGGHQRWLDNPFGQNSAGPGAVRGPASAPSTRPPAGRCPGTPPRTGTTGPRSSTPRRQGSGWAATETFFAGQNRPGIVFCPLT